MTFLKKAGLVVLILFAGALALIGIASMTRGTPVRHVLAEGDRSGIPPVHDSLFGRTIELFAGTHIEPGNRVEMMSNGNETYPLLWRDIRGARQTLTVQMYYSQPGAVADTMAAYLAERARAKVRVLLLLDAFGSQNLKDEWIDGLRQAGVEVHWLRPVHWYSLHKAGQRSHNRVVVVDGRIGYTGGFGLADYWLGDGVSHDQWRDTNVRFQGPAVAQLQAAFSAAWAEATGELITGDVFYPPISFDEAGPHQAGLLHTAPTIGSTPAERFLALSLTAAQRTLYITNSYFVPDDDFRGMLLDAAKRGVDVRILTAGDDTDVKTTLHAGRARYEQLLRGGVRIYEYQPSMMHAKTFVVDGLWSTVGTLNFDNRSLAFNNESNLVVLNQEFGARMDSLFMADVRHAKEITLATHLQRPWKGRVLEWGANLLSRLL